MEDTDKQPQTIGEWLDWAEEQGYEWAKEAREEALKEPFKEDLNIKVPTISDIKSALSGAFSWGNSNKGAEYWVNIYKSL